MRMHLIKLLVAALVFATVVAGCGVTTARLSSYSPTQAVPVSMGVNLVHLTSAAPRSHALTHWSHRSRGVISLSPLPSSSIVPSLAVARARAGWWPSFVSKSRWTLTKSRTKSVMGWITKNENVSQTTVIGGSGLLCGWIFSSTGPGAVAAGALCSFYVALYWSSLKDVKKQISKKKACFQTTLNSIPMVSWFSFAAVTCTANGARS